MRNFKLWVKEHIKELIALGICITTLIAIIKHSKNNGSIDSLWNSLDRLVGNEPNESQNVTNKTIEDLVQTLGSESVVSNIEKEPFFNSVLTNHDPIEVSNHIRNLPEGWNASPLKIETAQDYGFNLEQGQTWVDSYTKYDPAA